MKVSNEDGVFIVRCDESELLTLRDGQAFLLQHAEQGVDDDALCVYIGKTLDDAHKAFIAWTPQSTGG